MRRRLENFATLFLLAACASAPEHSIYVFEIHEDVYRNAPTNSDPIAMARIGWFQSIQRCGAAEEDLLLNQFQVVVTKCTSPPRIAPFEANWGSLYEINQDAYDCLAALRLEVGPIDPASCIKNVD